MDHNRLLESLKHNATNLTRENLSEIDFEALQGDLEATVILIEELQSKSRIGERLVELLKSELAARASAIARLQGEDEHLAARLLERSDLTFEELLEIRTQIEREFDAVFSQRLSEPAMRAGMGEKPSELKQKHQPVMRKQ
jgi:hypothetical protein